MPKIKLDKAYFWEGKSYVPGEEVEVPDELAKALGQLEPPPIPNSEEPAAQDPPSEEVPPSTTKTKRSQAQERTGSLSPEA